MVCGGMKVEAVLLLWILGASFLMKYNTFLLDLWDGSGLYEVSSKRLISWLKKGLFCWRIFEGFSTLLRMATLGMFGIVSSLLPFFGDHLSILLPFSLDN